MGAVDEGAKIADRSVRGRVLEQGSEDRFLRAGFSRAGENADAERFRPGLQEGNRLGMTMIGDKESVSAPDVVAEGHGLRRGGGLIEQGGVGDLHPREVADHRLKIQQGFQASLGDFRLIRCIGGIPARVLQDVPADDRGSPGAVVACSDEGLREDVAVHQGPEIVERLFLFTCRGECQIPVEPDAGGNGFRDEGFQRGCSDNPEHGLNFRPGGPDMAGGKRAHSPIWAL